MYTFNQDTRAIVNASWSALVAGLTTDISAGLLGLKPIIKGSVCVCVFVWGFRISYCISASWSSSVVPYVATMQI